MKNLQKKPLELSELAIISDYERVRQQLRMKLIHREKNRELLKDVPYILFLDLAVVFYVTIREEEGGVLMTMVRNVRLFLWNLSLERLKVDAISNMQKNVPMVLESLESCMARLVGGILPSRLSVYSFFQKNGF